MPATPLLEPLLHRLREALAARRRFPESTYRVQFHAGFTFRAAADLVPYLHDLGVTDLYASPYLQARPGSQHGYDISDHRTLNPEIGGPEDHAALVHALRSRGMGQVLDVVPNHMGIVGNENAWWNDVLENGPSSQYASFFDIDWHSARSALQERVLLPLLGEPYGKVLEAGQIQLRYDKGVFTLHYFDHRFPVASKTYALVLRHRVEELAKLLGAEAPPFLEYQSILTALGHLPGRNETDPAKIAERQREKEVVKRRLAALTEGCGEVRDFIAENIRLVNGTVGDPRSFDLLDRLLDEQAYRLSFWRVAADEINYRRFFDVNELAAVSQERPEVFAATHELLFRLLREGQATGLRIDHPDGLYDPREYLERLQEQYVVEIARQIFETVGQTFLSAGQTAMSAPPTWADLEGPLREEVRRLLRDRPEPVWDRPLYVLVEKILGKGEPVPEDWPVYGTTGYEYLNALNGLFVDAAQERTFSRLYGRWTGGGAPLSDLVFQKKFLILQVALSSELHVLANQLDRIALRNRYSRDFTLNGLRHALRTILACFPVYRAYITGPDVLPRDRFYVEAAVARSKRKNPALSASLFDFVRDVVLLKGWDMMPEAERVARRHFVGKFQQVTAPVMAKGLEDTAFYVYNRLVALNEVGGDPDQFGLSPTLFHLHNQDRRDHWPHALSATSTHDTKRSEDVRARLNVLSELPQEWQRCLSLWKRLNRRSHTQIEDQAAPDANDEYLLYQTLVGAWPLEPYSAEEFATSGERIQAYMHKAIHEAKVHSSWINPNPPYADAVRRFVVGILDEKTNAKFLDDLRAFVRRVSHFGLFNSLAQTLLKIASPGAPDIYQGTELWDFSLVDPDNRRPVDYERRRRLLDELRARPVSPELAEELTRTKEDGRIKLYVTSKALHCRRDHPGLFSTGEYQATDAIGRRRENVVGFVRRWENRCAVVAIPRLVTQFVGPGRAPVDADAWHDTFLLLPGVQVGQRFHNLFTDELLLSEERDGHVGLPLAAVFGHFPVALFLARD